MDPEMDSSAKRQAETRGVKSVMAVGVDWRAPKAGVREERLDVI
jgi:hypothetical protein